MRYFHVEVSLIEFYNRCFNISLTFHHKLGVHQNSKDVVI